MSNGIFDLLVLALTTVVIAMIAIAGMVHLELGPAAKLKGHRRFFLMTALGAGVITFSAKIVVMIGFITHPPIANGNIITESSNPETGSHKPPQYHWTPLPQVATYTGKPRDNATSTYIWEALPEQVPSPQNNPTTAAKVVLGKMLFNDKQLSHDKTLSCASCHSLDKAAGADGRKTAKGIHGQIGDRNTPTVWNSAFQTLLFWDGRAASLEDQAKGPLVNPIEMGMPSFTAVEIRVKRQPHYRNAFDDAFGADTAITIDRIAKAIAAYERTLITSDTPYDRFVRGDHSAMTPQQIRGMALFESLGCVSCHQGPNFSSASVFNGQFPRRIFPANPTPYENKYDLLVDIDNSGIKQRSVWRVPSLRNVALTGPWLHNGSVTTLEEAIRIMASTQLGWSGHYLLWSEANQTLQEISRPVPSERQINDIVAFLHALSSDRLILAESIGGISTGESSLEKQ